MKRKITSLIALCALALNAQGQISTWESFSTGSGSVSNALIVTSDGTLYAGGNFINGGSVFTFGEWDGSAWNSVGGWTFMNGLGFVYALLEDGDDLYVGGTFSQINNDPNLNHIARYNRTTQTWTALGQGLNGWVYAIQKIGNTVYAGGRFTDAGGDPNADYVAQFDGTSWSALNSTVISPSSFTSVNALAVIGSDLYVGGNFEDGGGITGADYVIKYDGANWVSIGNYGSVGATMDLLVDGTDLYAGGEFVPKRVAKYNGSTWSEVGNGFNMGTVQKLGMINNNLYAVGSVKDAGGNADADYIAKLESGNWSFVADGLNGDLWDIDLYQGKVVVGGQFTDAGGNTNADNVALLGNGGSGGLFENSMDLLHVYPNPASDILNLGTPLQNWTIYSANEQVVMSSNNTETTYIQIQHLQPGLYILRSGDRSARFIRK